MFLTHEALAALPHVRHGFFTRTGGVSGGVYQSLNTGLGSDDARDKVLENRARIADALNGKPENLAVAYQVHSAEAVEVNEVWTPGNGPQLDGLVTTQPDVLLGASHADCAPLLFADRERSVVGACHAGWRGAFTGIAEATIDAMERLGAARARIVAVIGPTISQDAYEVGPEFHAQFLAQSAQNARFFIASAKAGHVMFDLPGYLVARLEAAGTGTVANMALCTYSNEEKFFSYRRMTHRKEPDYGRHLAVIRLAG